MGNRFRPYLEGRCSIERFVLTTSDILAPLPTFFSTKLMGARTISRRLLQGAMSEDFYRSACARFCLRFLPDNFDSLSRCASNVALYPRGRLHIVCSSIDFQTDTLGTSFSSTGNDVMTLYTYLPRYLGYWADAPAKQYIAGLF